MEFQVQSMSCSHCASAITQAVKQLDPQSTVSIDLPAKKVTVESTRDRTAIAAALREAGYPAV